MRKIAAIVVTYNRVSKLKKNISSLLQQSYGVSDVIVVDNNSNDGTSEYLKTMQDKNKLIHVYTLSENLGGAGGFCYGLKIAFTEYHDDYFWMMDDDTIPNENALKSMVHTTSTLKDDFGFLCSDVKWIDNSPALMNVPMPTRDWNSNTFEDLVKVKYATFVSIIISRKIVKEIGLPYSEFFLWGDDIEYTSTISKRYPSYFVKTSKVIHEMADNSAPNILTTSQDRIPRFYYDFRNRYVIERENRGKIRGNIKATMYGVSFFLKVLFQRNQSLKKLVPIVRGSFAGLFFKPKRRYVE